MSDLHLPDALKDLPGSLKELPGTLQHRLSDLQDQLPALAAQLPGVAARRRRTRLRWLLIALLAAGGALWFARHRGPDDDVKV